MNSLMGEITSNTNTYGWYSAVRLAELFTESAKTSFDSVGDTMPY